MRITLIIVSIALVAGRVDATPLEVAGFVFADGERAFVDSASLVLGTVTGTTEEEVQSVLVGPDLGPSIRVITPDEAVIELVFEDNLMLNGDGTDLVIFERSGSGPAPGTPDPNERFGVSIFDGVSFSPFAYLDPVATGFPDPLGDTTLQIYVVEIDLSDFGLAAGATSDRFRIHLVDNLASRSADPMGAAALNSVPEPGTFVTLALGLACLPFVRRSVHRAQGRSGAASLDR